MKIKIKKGVKLSSDNNRHGLDLNDFYKLQAGKEVEVDNVSDSLKEFIESKSSSPSKIKKESEESKENE